MEYLKFNCHELAGLCSEFLAIQKKISVSEDRLADIIRSLNPSGGAFASIHGQLQTEKIGLQELTQAMARLYNALGAIVDVYSHAEESILASIRNLPVDLNSDPGMRSEPRILPGEISVSSISSHNLIVEDWLAELVVKQANSVEG